MEVSQKPPTKDLHPSSWSVASRHEPVPKKRKLTMLENVLYWLDWGKNSNSLYEPQESHSFIERVIDARQQQELLKGLEVAIAFYGGKLRRNQIPSTSQAVAPAIQITSYVRKKRGYPTVIIREVKGVQRLEHTWIKPLTREKRLH